MDNKTFNGLFHRLLFRQSRAARTTLCLCVLGAGELHVLLEKSVKLTYAQLINRVIIFPSQQRWIRLKYIYLCCKKIALYFIIFFRMKN